MKVVEIKGSCNCEKCCLKHICHDSNFYLVCGSGHFELKEEEK